MRDLSLYILDLTMNSIRAQATLVEMNVIEFKQKNLLMIKVKDNGQGMSEEMIGRVRDPFFTTRTTRKVGLGIPLLTAMASRCEGEVFIDSKIGVGTTVTLKIRLDHIDRPPFGDIHNTLISLIYLEPIIDFNYTHRSNECEYQFKTQSIKQVIGDVPINHSAIIEWMKKELEAGDFSFTSY